MENILGIDIRACSVKVIEFAWKDGKPFVAKVAMADLPVDLLEEKIEKDHAQSETLKKLIHDNHITARRAFIVIGGPDMAIRKISLPSIPASELKETIRLQAENLVSYPSEEIVFDFYKLSPKPVPEIEGEEGPEGGPENKSEQGNNEYIVAINKRSIVDKMIKMTHDAGLQPICVTAVPVALQAFFSPAINNDEVTSIIYMGKFTTNISIFQNNELLFSREISLGGDSITQGLIGVVITDRGKVSLTSESAEKLKLTQGLPLDIDEYQERTGLPAGEINAMIRPAIEKIEAEILRSFDFFGVKVSRIILTGGSSVTKQFPEILSRALKIKVETVKVMAQEDEINMAQLSAAVGAAMEGGKKINLIPDEYKYRWAIAVQKLLKNPAVSGTAALVIAVIIYLAQTSMYVNMNRGYQGELAQLNQLTPQVDRLDILNQKMQGANTFAQDRFFKVFEEINKLVPNNIWLDKLDYSRSDNDLKISGKANGTISNFMLVLKASRLIANVQLISLNPDLADPGFFDFVIDCGLFK